ncbi:Reticulon [Trema orientale]|uniref:Reticulon-like protein n=1 Tax=Trema orientale TaxID=63057 RepID=A0A2P5ELT9_TREOI|nr:Reticulon [Trema orientale]
MRTVIKNRLRSVLSLSPRLLRCILTSPKRPRCLPNGPGSGRVLPAQTKRPTHTLRQYDVESEAELVVLQVSFSGKRWSKAVNVAVFGSLGWIMEKNNAEGDGDARKANTNPSSSSSTSGQASVYHSMGGGTAADVLFWKRRRVSFGVIVVATVALFEWSGLSFLSICSDVLLILIVLVFLRTNYATLRNKQPQPLPELVLSEEMANNVAASFRVKINNVLLMAHSITFGKDFRLFFKVVVYLWLLSVTGSFFLFFTIAYIGMYNIHCPSLSVE